ARDAALEDAHVLQAADGGGGLHRRGGGAGGPAEGGGAPCRGAPTVRWQRNPGRARGRPPGPTPARAGPRGSGGRVAARRTGGGVAAQRRVGGAAPGAVVVLGVAAARGGVDGVDQRAVLAHQQLAAGGLDRGGGARIFAAGAGVDLAVDARAEAVGIGEVAGA